MYLLLTMQLYVRFQVSFFGGAVKEDKSLMILHYVSKLKSRPPSILLD